MKKFMLVAVVLLLTAVPSLAQWTVFDPSNYAQALEEVSQLTQQLQQLQQSYNLAMSQYNLLTSQYKQLTNLPSRYQYTFTQWKNLAPANTYGNTQTWTNGLNSGSSNDIATGYRQLVPAVQKKDSTITGTDATEWQQQYGLLEMQDAATLDGAQTVGDVRVNVQNTNTAITSLEKDVMASDPDQTSQAALLQKLNVELVLLVRQMQDTNRLLVAIAQLQLQQQAQARWERGRQLNMAATTRN
jgi:hypothetical protein